MNTIPVSSGAWIRLKYPIMDLERDNNKNKNNSYSQIEKLTEEGHSMSDNHKLLQGKRELEKVRLSFEIRNTLVAKLSEIFSKQ